MDNELIHSTGRRGIKEEILKLRREGMSYNDISKELTCSKGTISLHCTSNGLADIGLKATNVDNELKKKIFEYSKTHNVLETMKHLNLGRTTIKKYKFKKHLHGKL